MVSGRLSCMLEWNFLGESAVLGSPMHYKEANGLTPSPSLTRIEFFLWSVGDLSSVNRCSLPCSRWHHMLGQWLRTYQVTYSTVSLGRLKKKGI